MKAELTVNEMLLETWAVQTVTTINTALHEANVNVRVESTLLGVSKGIETLVKLLARSERQVKDQQTAFADALKASFKDQKGAEESLRRMDADPKWIDHDPAAFIARLIKATVTFNDVLTSYGVPSRGESDSKARIEKLIGVIGSAAIRAALKRDVKRENKRAAKTNTRPRYHDE